MVNAHVDTEQLTTRGRMAPSEVAAIDDGQPVLVPSPLEFLRDLDRLAATLGLPSAEGPSG